jgi:predicted nucleotidyltransferase
MKAINLMEALMRRNLFSLTYGSIVRGDVKPTSDVDVFIPDVVPSHDVELALMSAGYNIISREVVQATPSYVVKGYIYVDELTSVSFPLIPMRSEEEMFYSLAGKADLDELMKDVRKPGINKELMLIVPTEEGHYELAIEGGIEEVAKVLSVDPNALRKRVYVLKRRKEIGRTGVYRSILLQPDDSFESVLKKLIDTSPSLRRRLKEYR